MPHVGWQNASPSGQSKIAIPPDPAGWNEAKWKVGQFLRIPLEGLQAGNHDPNNLPALTGEAADGKAVILIPKALTRDKIDPTKPLEVLLHFHGHSIGYRQANSTIDDRTGHWERGWVEDVDIDQIAQQIEASGRSLVAVLPQGTNHSGFGKAPSPPKNYFKNYLDEVFKALVSRQIWTQIPTVKRVILSAHSGGGDFLVNSVGDLPTFDLPPAVFLFDAINNDTGRSAYWIWLKRYLDAELNLITSRKLSDPLQYVKDSLQWLAFHSNRSYQRAHDQFAKDLNAWFASHEKDLGGKSTPVYEQMKANYQVIPVGHGTHYMMGVLMANQLFPIMQPLAYALSGLPFHTAGTDSLSTSPTGQSSKHRPWVEQTDLDSEREVWRQKMLDVQASFEADDSVSATSYQNKIFAIESADARLRNNDLSPKKFKAGDTLPSGKKIGDYVTLPRGAQVKISDMKTDGNKKVFALVYEATAGSAASPLGWTSTENFKGKLHNETFGAEPANYIVEPAARADFFTVGNHEALVRKGSPSYALDKTKAKLSQGSFVAVVEESKDTTPAGKYVKVVSLKKSGGSFITDKDLGWTAKNNLVPGLADYKGPNAAWESFDYVKQIDLLAIVAIESKEEKIARDVDPAYIQMIQAAAAEGIEIVLNDGFRRYSDQEKLYNLYQQGKGNPAYPPGSSNHQNGIAFDLIVQHGSADKGVGTGTVYDWLKKNATSHGFVRTVPGEAWHWEYRPVLADQLQKQGKYKSWQLSERENEDFLDEEEDNAAEQVAGIDWCNIRRRISCVALVQEARWTRPDGTKRLENEPDMLPVLEEYWRTVPSINPTVKAQQSANDATAWSAAFICFIIYTAGVRAAHGFEFGERHMAYIVGALRNRERSDRNRPFWLYDQVELAKEATPEIGDLLCFNRVDNGTMTNHSYANLRRQFWEPNQNAAPTGSSHCSVVVDIISRGGRRFIQTVGGNESVPGLGDRGWTVRLKEIEIDQHGAILNPNAIHVFGVIKLLECRNLT
jgi:LAS superfamily LD-carboxypeptidase LdcB